MDKHMRTYIHTSGAKNASSSRGRPEIDRKRLIQLLRDSVQGKICWGHRLQNVVEEDGRFSLHFMSDIVESGYDLVVGADGAWSKVRTFLTDVEPEYSGVSGVQFTISNPQTRCPDIYKLVNRGSMFAYSDSRSIMAQQLGTGDLGLSTWSRAPVDSIRQLRAELNKPDIIKASLKNDRADWSPQLLKFIDMSDSSPVVRNLYQLPVGTRWNNRPGVTLMGDAAHLTTPFAGEGVNQAMLDAMNLCKAIKKATAVSTSQGLAGQIREYEEEMFVRGSKVQTLTCETMSLMFMTPGAPETTIEKWIIAAASDNMEESPWLKRTFKYLVYTYFWVWKLFHPLPKQRMTGSSPEVDDDLKPPQYSDTERCP
jgi:2-polyprenyl-6-methoxyphenol hydroxylase-like FAD-dependent oxidoreductase